MNARPLFAICEPLRVLSAREQAFAVAYARGRDPAGAAREAGYAPHRAGDTATRLLARPTVRTAVLAVSALTASIPDPEFERRRQWWTRIMRGQVPPFGPKDQLYASELLAQSELQAGRITLAGAGLQC